MAFGLHKMKVFRPLYCTSAFELSTFSLVAGKNIASILVLPALVGLIHKCYPSKLFARTAPIYFVSPKTDLKQHPQLNRFEGQQIHLKGSLASDINSVNRF